MNEQQQEDQTEINLKYMIFVHLFEDKLKTKTKKENWKNKKI